MKKMRDMKFFIYIISLMGTMAGLVSCADDDKDNVELPKAYDSMIFQAIEPENLYYSSEEIKYEFIYNKNHDSIYDWRINGFNLRLIGKALNNHDNRDSFNKFLKELGDTAVGNKLPTEAWNYIPLTKAISRIEIFSDANQEPDIVKGEECSRYFEISFTSWYDYIKNGYSWDGLGTTSPTKRMSIEEFNNTPEKMLVDACRLEFHISPIISDKYVGHSTVNTFWYNIKFYFTDGTNISGFISVIDDDIEMFIMNLIINYNFKPRFPF